MASATAHGYSGTWSIPEMESLIANIQKRMEWINTNDTTCQPLRKIYRRNLTYLYQNSRNIHLLKVGLEAGGFHSQDFASIKDEDSFQNFKQLYDTVFKTLNCNGLMRAWKTSGNEHLLDLSARILLEHQQDPSLSGFGQDDPLPQNGENIQPNPQPPMNSTHRPNQTEASTSGEMTPHDPLKNPRQENVEGETREDGPREDAERRRSNRNVQSTDTPKTDASEKRSAKSNSKNQRKCFLGAAAISFLLLIVITITLIMILPKTEEPDYCAMAAMRIASPEAWISDSCVPKLKELHICVNSSTKSALFKSREKLLELFDPKYRDKSLTLEGFLCSDFLHEYILHSYVTKFNLIPMASSCQCGMDSGDRQQSVAVRHLHIDISKVPTDCHKFVYQSLEKLYFHSLLTLDIKGVNIDEKNQSHLRKIMSLYDQQLTNLTLDFVELPASGDLSFIPYWFPHLRSLSLTFQKGSAFMEKEIVKAFSYATSDAADVSSNTECTPEEKQMYFGNWRKVTDVNAICKLVE